jgi:hypothetical protein
VELVSEGVNFSVKCGKREVTDCVTSSEPAFVYITFPYITSYCVLVRHFALLERAIERELDTVLLLLFADYLAISFFCSQQFLEK